MHNIKILVISLDLSIKNKFTRIAIQDQLRNPKNEIKEKLKRLQFIQQK
jgi:hypothetical protein